MENVESIAVVDQKTKSNGRRIEKLEQSQEIIVAVEQRAKSNSHRIDKLEKNQEAIQQLALSVRELATQMQGMREEQADTSKRLAELERKPASMWDKLVAALIGAIAAGLAGAALSLIIR